MMGEGELFALGSALGRPWTRKALAHTKGGSWRGRLGTLLAARCGSVRGGRMRDAITRRLLRGNGAWMAGGIAFWSAAESGAHG